MKRRSLLVFALLAAVMLSACSADVNLLDETKLSDTSLLTGEPCLAPCWNDIIPGETRYRDAKLIIEGDERYQITEEPEPQEGNPGRVFAFGEGENPACCQVFSRDGETVSSFLLQMAPVMAYGPAFDQYGEPDYALGLRLSEEQSYVLLVYPDVPLIIYAFVEGGEQAQVSVNSQIIGAMYASRTEMDELLNCQRLNFWGGFQALSRYVVAEDEEYDYVGEGFGDEAICPTE